MSVAISDVRVGDVLIADSGFSCLDDQEQCEVRAGESGRLYVPCRKGRHYLEGQLDAAERHYVGFRKKEG